MMHVHLYAPRRWHALLTWRVFWHIAELNFKGEYRAFIVFESEQQALDWCLFMGATITRTFR